MEQPYALSRAEVRSTAPNCTTGTSGFFVSAAQSTLQATLGVKRSQVQILSSRRRDRVVSLHEASPDLRPDLHRPLSEWITS